DSPRPGGTPAPESEGFVSAATACYGRRSRERLERRGLRRVDPALSSRDGDAATPLLVLSNPALPSTTSFYSLAQRWPIADEGAEDRALTGEPRVGQRSRAIGITIGVVAAALCGVAVTGIEARAAT